MNHHLTNLIESLCDRYIIASDEENEFGTYINKLRTTLLDHSPPYVRKLLFEKLIGWNLVFEKVVNNPLVCNKLKEQGVPDEDCYNAVFFDDTVIGILVSAIYDLEDDLKKAYIFVHDVVKVVTININRPFYKAKEFQKSVGRNEAKLFEEVVLDEDIMAWLPRPTSIYEDSQLYDALLDFEIFLNDTKCEEWAEDLFDIIKMKAVENKEVMCK